MLVWVSNLCREIRSGLERSKNASHTSITNQISYETVLCETLGMVHHSGATANVSEDQDGNRAQRMLVPRAKCFPSKPYQPDKRQEEEELNFGHWLWQEATCYVTPISNSLQKNNSHFGSSCHDHLFHSLFASKKCHESLEFMYLHPSLCSCFQYCLLPPQSAVQFSAFTANASYSSHNIPFYK